MSDLKNLDSFTLETSKNHLISNFLRNGRLRVKHTIWFLDTIRSQYERPDVDIQSNALFW